MIGHYRKEGFYQRTEQGFAGQSQSPCCSREVGGGGLQMTSGLCYVDLIF